MDNFMCPVCLKIHQTLTRYETAVCNECVSTYNTRDKNGNVIIFYNTSSDGSGCEGKIIIDGKTIITENTQCYVNGIECIASEARFGGIVVCANIYNRRKIKVIFNGIKLYNYNLPKNVWYMHRDGDLKKLLYDQACLLNVALNTNTDKVTSILDGDGFEWTAFIIKENDKYYYKNSSGKEYLLTNEV